MFYLCRRIKQKVENLCRCETLSHTKQTYLFWFAQMCENATMALIHSLNFVVTFPQLHEHSLCTVFSAISGGDGIMKAHTA